MEKVEALAPEASDLNWSQPFISDDSVQPVKRSGHTLTVIGSNAFMFGGCDADGSAEPNNDVWLLKMAGNFSWEKLNVAVTQDGEAPERRWRHSGVIMPGGSFVLYFGGFRNSQNRLNDLWILDTVTYTWQRPTPKSVDFTPNGNHTPVPGAALGPSARGAHTASVVGKLMYVFGGYGGSGYMRRDLNDLWTLDLETFEWAKVASAKGNTPSARSGHTASVVEKKIYVYGGWSASQQFSDLTIFDTAECTWEGVDVNSGVERPARWNHSACSVEAIPNWKVFVFGGVTGDLNESKKAQGTYRNDVLVMDTGATFFEDPNVKGEAPPARSLTEMAYDSKGSRLVLFGGWANKWYGDLHTLDVGCVVGPPYAVMGVHPSEGPVTGEQEIELSGIDFIDDKRDTRIKVRFATRRGVVDVPAEFVSKEKIRCKTPNFEKMGTGKISVDVRVAFRDDSFTTTFVRYNFNPVSDNTKCLGFGPGLLEGGAAAVPTMFVITANDTAGIQRTTGGDHFNVSVTEENGEAMVVDISVDDQGDGTYVCHYTAPIPSTYKIDVEFAGIFTDVTGKEYNAGKAGPIRGSPFTVTFADGVSKSLNNLEGGLVTKHLQSTYDYVRRFSTSAKVQLEKAINSKHAAELKKDMKLLLAIKEKLLVLSEETESIDLSLDTMTATATYLQEKMGMNMAKKLTQYQTLRSDWDSMVAGNQNMVTLAKTTIKPYVQEHGANTKVQIEEYDGKISQYEANFKAGSSLAFYSWSTGPEGASKALADAYESHEITAKETEDIVKLAHLFEFPELCGGINAAMERVAKQLEYMQALWGIASDALTFIEESKSMLWRDVKPDVLEEEAKDRQKKVKSISKEVRWANAFEGLDKVVKDFLITCPLILQLGSKAMRSRHWKDLKQVIAKDFTSPDQDDSLKLSEVLNLNLHEFAGDVEEIADQAVKEEKIELALDKLSNAWLRTADSEGIVFVEEETSVAGVYSLRMGEEDFEVLEADQLSVQGFMGNRFVGFFLEEYIAVTGKKMNGVQFWQQSLVTVADVMALLADIQRTWSYLEPLFMRSDEVKQALPKDAERFSGIDSNVKSTLSEMRTTKNVREACNKPNLLSSLESINKELEMCKKSLSDYLDNKRTIFPRFYFTSEADLLDILSNGANPVKIMKHITKVFLATKTFELDESSSTPTAVSWVAGVGKEVCVFEPPCKLEGKVEIYLQDAHDAQRYSQVMNENFKRSARRYPTQPRTDWLLNKKDDTPTDLAQISLLVGGMNYVNEVEDVFNAIGAGNKDAMKDYSVKQKQQLSDLIVVTLTKLSKADRTRVMVMITMDAHGRDIVEKLIREDVQSKTEFQWTSQMKQRWAGDDDSKPFCQICDASFVYSYEYLGNGGRLVITPLTDRIYVTATQALHLKMGCAPAGPAGTGKTETTKDLAAALGKVCYVFNCAPEMDYRSMGNIFKGLAASGSWGCFDEFNRLIPEVLSVCTVQFKAVTDGIAAGNSRVTIEGVEVHLDHTCGAFITMNPGYLGRSTLPEGLKALFRPMTVMVPDLVLICENMMMAEGFKGAKVLASKFYGLYSLLGALLSKQKHYDWGLRAVKSVLVVAGGFKRDEPDLLEQELLLRALRDFNIPKIVKQDEIIFFGLLTDLFPGLDPPRKVDATLENAVQEACGARNMWPDETFMLKAVQLEELLAIRHCVFVMGPPAAGKTECWRTLARARGIMGNKTKVQDINPKAQNPSGLYGFISLATREWKDGLLSKLMRDMGQESNTDPKWIILDGDLDANWIESMNSVMDDNRMLTLASNERIPLLPHMKMIFEIRDLVYATPATTSRAGIIYISVDDGTQWRSLIAAWVQKQEVDDHVKEALSALMTTYANTALDFIRKNLTPLIPIEQTNMVSSLLYMLNTLITPAMVKAADAKEAQKKLEATFVFCSVWAFGSSLAEKDGVDYRKQFSDWWKGEFKVVKFPSRETIFDYFLNPETDKFDLWKNSPYFYEIPYDSQTTPMSQVTVPTPETASISHWLQKMVEIDRPCLLVGSSGCGKTAIIQGLLRNLDENKRISSTINFNFYTSAIALQGTMESKLVKKTGTNFGPKGTVNLVYFLDDLNLPEVDPYNTQDAIALVRQHIDYGHIYDRNKLTLKNINNCQYLACMNQTAGSFIVNPRLQRHFVTFAIGFPGMTSLLTIYQTFLDGHLVRFSDQVKALSSKLIQGALNLHQDVVGKFRKSAVNFHYEFNVRHLSNVFQGLLVSQPSEFDDPGKFVKLWLHESERVYGDRLVSYTDLRKYKELAAAQAKRNFPSYNMSKFFAAENADPLIFCHFPENIQDKVYDEMNSTKTLNDILVSALNEYNDTNAAMNLVLFDDAMKHVCRIARIILNPSGHAMLVGVGGSGKQSLSRLASFVCGYDTKQVVITPTYGINDLKEDLKVMYTKAGVKGDGVTFLFTDSQITNERFLVYINDLLASGNIPDLYTAEDIDGIVGNVSNKAKAAGVDPNSKADVYEWFLNQIRKNLHCVLCFSPVGDDFRNRALKFPALVNSTVIDWFQPWPYQALFSVGQEFLKGVDEVTPEVMAGIEGFMPKSFESVNAMATTFFNAEKRYVYTTPKSYLELLKLYTQMLKEKRKENKDAEERLSNGLTKLRSTAEIVSTLEAELKVKLVAAEEKRVAAEAEAEDVNREKAIVDTETAKANVEAEKCNKIATEVQVIKDDAQNDLDNAEPLVAQAMAALDTLNKKDLGECKGMTTPPKGVDDVFVAAMILLAGTVKTIEVSKAGKVKKKDWDGAKKQMMGNVNQFLEDLKGFKAVVDDFKVPKINWKEVRPYLALEHFTAEGIGKKNSAAGGLASWVINIVVYYDTITGVEPKRIALAEAEAKLSDANTKLDEVNEKVRVLTENLNKLTKALNEANAIKEAAIKEVEEGQQKLDLAQRLITALASENVRWAGNIDEYKARYDLLTGDVLLASAFISYVGPFTKEYRDLLMAEWSAFLSTAAAGEPIPMTAGGDPMAILTDSAQIAGWNVDGLPSDPVSSENGAITMSSSRWPLIIDPQLQGIAWISSMCDKQMKARLADGLGDGEFKIVRLGQKDIISKMIYALENGEPIMIENLGEKIDAALMPVVMRATIKRGRKQYIKIGDKECDFHPDFKLYLHTKLSNPHYPPELQAECSLVNFTVTEKGLEDQLLASVVRKERADLAEQRAQIIQQQNRFTVKVKELEDYILKSLAEAKGDITTNVELIEGLEDTKRTANDIAEKTVKANETNAMITEVSEKYRAVATRGSLLFFIMSSMYKMHSYYTYSLNAFAVIFLRGIDLVTEKKEKKPTSMMARLRAAAKKVIVTQRFSWNTDVLRADREVQDTSADVAALFASAKSAEPVKELSDEEVAERCEVLMKSITSVVFNYIRRGLFDQDKLCIATQVCFKILTKAGVIDPEEMKVLVVGKPALDPGSMGPLSEWMPETTFAKVKGLEVVKAFETLADDIMSDSDDWQTWFDAEKPELAKMPGNYNGLSAFEKLFIYRAIRPDRMNGRLSAYVEENLGSEFVNQPAFDMEATYQESSPSTPVFFVLFPGVDPTPWVEGLGKKMDITEEKGKFFNISMGQGQEANAAAKLQEYSTNGGWLMLQNVHLMTNWLPTLERTLEQLSVTAHQDFRCFISAEPPALKGQKNMPESLMQSCIKVSNEAPADLKSNLRMSWANFSQERFEGCSKPAKFRQCVFTLCFFHGLVLGRRKFGQMGWSRKYSFNQGDLNICANVCETYINDNPDVPWADLRYIFGEIMYGGHITDAWDRRTNNTYLSVLLEPGIFQNKKLAPGFDVPPLDGNYSSLSEHLEQKLPPEAPSLFGLHANAEIGYLTSTQQYLFSCLLDLSGGGGGGGGGRDDSAVKMVLSELLERLPENYNMIDIGDRAKALSKDEQAPYVIVATQETTRMNKLLSHMRDTLTELSKGLEGSLNMSEPMEDLATALSINQVPGRNPFHKQSWEKFAWWSSKSLQSWFADILVRVEKLSEWVDDLKLPTCLWISGLFNPTAFNTAIMQATSRKTGLPLDQMTTETHITTWMDSAKADHYPENGAFVYGLYMEGARWAGAGNFEGADEERGDPYDISGTPCAGHIVESKLKELLAAMPVMYFKAVKVQPTWEPSSVGYLRHSDDTYEAPIYVTTFRGPTYLFLATLKTVDPNSKWVMAGVALVLQNDE